MCEHVLSKKCWCNPIVEDYSEKQKVRFCWECGNRLRGNHYVIKRIDGNDRILHKRCAEKLVLDIYG